MPTLSIDSIRSRYQHAAAGSKSYTWFNYQPINLPGYEETLELAGRNCFDRSAAVSQAIERKFGKRRLKIIDWGCNLGFFVFELAKLGHEVVGVDSNPDYIDVCRFLAETNEFPVRPRFFSEKLTEDVLRHYEAFDVALCFSVFHHLGKERMSILRQFAELYPTAFIEMDGRDYGRHNLLTFFYELEGIAETNDPYGSGTRKRKTWLCSNIAGGARYRNLKHQNLLGGRSVMKKTSPDRISVVKREETNSSHTWINTNLSWETENYRRWGGTQFFPALIQAGEDDRYRWLEIEFAANDGSVNRDAIDGFFAFLEANALFLLDLSADSFLFSGGKLQVVDLESLFSLQGSVQDLISQVTKKTSVRLDSYEKQRNYILSRLIR